MTDAKYLGIWMDHSSAHMMEFSNDTMETKIIESGFTHEDKTSTLDRSEHVMHNKEQHQQKDFYKQLAEVIRNYKEVILFGPTDAKLELANFLKADHRFEGVKIETKSADKMNEHEQHKLVKEYFTKRISNQ